MSAHAPARSRSSVRAYEERLLAYEPTRERRPPRRRNVRRGRPTRRRILVRRWVALVLFTYLAWMAGSFVSTMAAPSNLPLSVRAIEWIRDHGGAWLVSDIESAYYSNNGPSHGGRLKALPSVGVGGAAAAASVQLPHSIAPVLRPALPGEGVWRRTGPLVAGAPPVLVTTFRPEAAYPTIVAGVAWIDTSRARLQLYAGRYQPPSASVRGPMEVPPAARAGLLATFNSGFKLQDSGGGFVTQGRVDAPLGRGLATIVGYSDGRVDVHAWDGPASPGPGVAFARQNLRLIVDNGVLSPKLSDGPEWGATLGNATRVWRSGIGVDASGNLIYAAADGQTVTSLARVLQRAGAVRAMELDINYEWVTFNSYAGPGAAAPAKLLPGMNRESTRYLSPDDRDFFAVTARYAP